MRADTRIAAGYVLGRRHTLRTAVMPAGAGWTGRFPGPAGRCRAGPATRPAVTRRPARHRGDAPPTAPSPPTRSQGEEHQVFLVTRMREEYVRGKPPREAMVAGYHHGARVVTSVAIIMISVFSAFMLEEDIAAKFMGFALAAGVFLDAFIVRMVVIPALLALLGESSWWLPNWLDRILPNVDIEGGRLCALAAAEHGNEREVLAAAR
ncbi:MMPL family transporter (plasmid) [Rhodococcus sp. DMU1]|nr:MMPL family transporter [Rhodococcus sp. DMU1]